MDDQTTLAKLKDSKKTEGIPVIMVTALADERNITTSQKGGAVEYVVKPFDYNVLLEKIEGSLTNVMGLPMELLQSVLAGLGRIID